MRHLQTLFLLLISIIGRAQSVNPIAAAKWTDSVYNSLTDDERIAQLMVVRLSSLDVKNNRVTFYDQQVTDLINKYNIGSICLFQGSPVKQAEMINSFQKIARTPIM